jgi:O-antigen/teichoic acid export membrane protein
MEKIMNSTKTRILKIGTGTLIAQLLTFLLLPFVTRIYTPEEYGKLSLFLALALVLIPIGTFKFDVILVVLGTEREAKDLLAIGIFTSTLISILTFPAIYTYLRLFGNVPNSNALLQSLLFSVFLLIQCLSVLFTQSLLRLKKDSRIAYSSILQNGSIGFLQIGLGKLKPTGEILISTFILGKIIGTSPLIKYVKKLVLNQQLNIRDLFETFKKHKTNGILVLSGTLMNATAIGLPTLVTGIFFGLHYSGIVAVTLSILTVPITLIGGAVGSVMISEVSSIKRDFPNDEFKVKSVIQTFQKILFFSSFIFILISITLGPYVFGLFLGNNWEEASRLVAWIAIPFGINFLWQPFSNLLYTNGNWKRYLHFSTVQLCLTLLMGAFALGMKFNWLYVAVSFVVGNSVAQVYGLLWIFGELKKSKFNL